MVKDLRQSVWRFYHKYNLMFSALLLVLAAIALIASVHFIPNQQASSVILGVGTSFIASVIFATLTRHFIEREFEDLLGETITRVLTESTDKILHRIDFKVDHLKKFMPIEPFVGREKASDLVERKAHDLFLKCRRYRSYGITGKYAVYRLHRAILDQVSNLGPMSKEIVLYVAHPSYIKKPIIFDPQTKRKELLGAMALIDDPYGRPMKKPDYQSRSSSYCRSPF